VKDPDPEWHGCQPIKMGSGIEFESYLGLKGPPCREFWGHAPSENFEILGAQMHSGAS